MKYSTKRILATSVGFVFFLAGFFSSCSTKEASKTDMLLAALLLQQYQLDLQGYYARLYRVLSVSTSKDSPVEITEVTSSNVGTLVSASRPKLVLVHGWLMGDTDMLTYPASSELKKRITDSGYWGFFFATDEFKTIFANYDVYAFDYHTGYGVDTNGALLRARLDTAFSTSDPGTVTIYAHSMGGLVNRFSLYEDLTAPTYLSKILSTGTPYHGSPWASPQWQEALKNVQLSFVADWAAKAVAFMTSTTGGSDLRWDNFDGSITGAENAKLTAVNAKTDRDNYITAWYGGCDINRLNSGDSSAKACYGSYVESIDGSTGYPELGSVHTLEIACSEIMRTVSGSDFNWQSFNTNDCVVPDKSAIKQTSGQGYSASQLDAGYSDYSATESLQGQDHFDMKMQVQPVRLKFLEFLGI